MTRMKLVLLTMLAVLATSAMASASASALEWLVELKSLLATEKVSILEGNAGTEKNEYESLTGAFILKTPNLEISCKFMKVNGGFIEGKTANGATSLEFLTCSAPKLPKCVIANVSTTALTSELGEFLAGKVTVAFKPKVGLEFTTIKTSGVGCLLPKSIVVKLKKETSRVVGFLLSAKDEDLAAQGIEFTKEDTELEAAGEMAEFLAEPDLELVGKKLWSWS